MTPLLSAEAETLKLMRLLRRYESKIVLKCFKLAHNIFSVIAFGYLP